MRYFLVERPKRAIRATRAASDRRGTRDEQRARAKAVGQLHLLEARARLRLVKPPVDVLGLRLHFGDLLWLFEEIMVRQPNAVDLPPAARIIDCGAKAGLSVVYVKQRLSDATVLAFEPAPDSYELLIRNIAANHLDRVECHEAAVAGEPGVVAVHIEPAVAGSVMATVGRADARPRLTATHDVAAVCLSDYVVDRVDLLKRDVEGSEADVLLDLHRTAKLAMVDRLLVESHHHLGGNALTLARTLSLLEDADLDYLVATPDFRSPVEATTSRTYSSTRPGRMPEPRPTIQCGYRDT